MKMQTLFWVIVVVFFGVILSSSMCVPSLLGNNEFLLNFINHEILNILAVIMTVTAASAANIHLAFNRAEEIIKKPNFFEDARKEVNQSVYWLIGLFLVTVLTLIIRSMFIDSLAITSFFNGLCLWFLLINILALIDITATVFAIHPLIPEDEKTEG